MPKKKIIKTKPKVLGNAVLAPTVVKTGNKMNPWVATSLDNLNVAYGQTEKGALANLAEGIKRRQIDG